MAAAQDLTAAADQHGNQRSGFRLRGGWPFLGLLSRVGIALAAGSPPVLCHSSKPLRGSDKPATVVRTTSSRAPYRCCCVGCDHGSADLGIYTRTGDAGQTQLADLSKVNKTDPRVLRRTEMSTRPTRQSGSLLRPVIYRTTSPQCYGAFRTRCSTSELISRHRCAYRPQPIPQPELRITQEYIDRLEAW